MQVPKTNPSSAITEASTRKRVLSAAKAILLRAGYAGLTMERVAAESGVAKTTLYRWWPHKAKVCMDVYLETAGETLSDPDTGDVETDLRQIVNSVVRLQTTTVAGAAFVGLIAEAQINPHTREACLGEFAKKRREMTRRVLARAVSRKQLRGDTDLDLVIDAVGGAATFRLLQGHAPLDEEFAGAIVRLVLRGCKACSSRERKHGCESES